MASILRLISSVALAVSLASSLTSLATTAKPLPASPARAASMVAFRARRLVCWAMEVMTLMTCPISAEESPSLATVALVVSATLTAEVATRGGFGGVLGDFLDAGAHLFGAGGDSLQVLADGLRGLETTFSLGGSLSELAVICWLVVVQFLARSRFFTALPRDE